MRKFTFIDLFAGCGGLSEGFLQSGLFEGLAHIEWELPMVQTLRTRLQDHWKHDSEDALKRVIYFDIQNDKELLFGNWSVESKSLYGKDNHSQICQLGLKGLVKDEVDVIVGGPPCQAYSIAKRVQDKNGMQDDYRNYLFESFAKIVKELQPKVFVFENVPGIFSSKPGDIPVLERIYKEFEQIGYSILMPEEMKKAVFCAADFGVPQNRNRVIIIGVKSSFDWDLSEIYNEINFRKTDKLVSVRDAIGDLPKFYPLITSKKINGVNFSHDGDYSLLLDHIPRYHNPTDIKIFRNWVESSNNSLSNKKKLEFYEKFKGRITNHSKYRNLEWDKLSPTIVAHLNKDGLLFIHPDPEQARSITVREAAILQSFPLNYQFLGSRGDRYKMIGNAVPPLMSQSLAIGLGNFLNKKLNNDCLSSM